MIEKPRKNERNLESACYHRHLMEGAICQSFKAEDGLGLFRPFVYSYSLIVAYEMSQTASIEPKQILFSTGVHQHGGRKSPQPSNYLQLKL